MNMNETSLLATTNPILLLAVFGSVIFISFICVRLYKDTNDFAKSVSAYIPIIIIANIIYMLLDIPVILIIGLDICGFVAMALISNYYFNL